MKKNQFSKIEKALIDLRILKDLQAQGISNAMIGFYFDEKNNVKFITDSLIAREHLLKFHVKPHDIYSTSMNTYMKLFKGEFELLLPLQRCLVKDFILSIFGIITFSSFIHDFHYLSSRKMLESKDSTYIKLLKKLIYLITIKLSRQIYCDSNLVRRQIKKLFNVNPKLVKLIRIFRSSDTSNEIIDKQSFDYLIKLDDREYKGLWAIPKLIFLNEDANIAVDQSFQAKVEELLHHKNPKVKVHGIDTKTDGEMISAFKQSISLLYLSRHEGYGFLPHEAHFFGCHSIVLKTTSFLGEDYPFHKLRFSEQINVPCNESLEKISNTCERVRII